MEMEYKLLLEKKYSLLLENMRAYMSHVDEKKVLEAYEFALQAHEGQVRRSGDPYIVHPLEVSLILSRMNLDTETIIASLLHDIIEDTRYGYKDIRAKFGGEVANLVEGVTKLTRTKYSTIEDQQMENLRKMFLAMAKDIRVMMIKIADRLHNMRTISYMAELRRREISRETMEVYAPIAHRMGMQKIKWELEDIALQELDPIGYSEIIQELEESTSAHAGFLEEVCDTITARLHEEGIHEFQIENRIKHVYSIYRKMMIQHKAMFEIYDLYAIRIIVTDLADCYNVLGLMHDLYKPIPGRFKDYISTPKPNLYQSLHSTVIGRAGQPFEIQIRTSDMHRIAELGIAAHWKYKDGVAKTDDALEQQLVWVRSLLESQQDTDAEDFISGIKNDMFADEVFVFTPNGDVKNLPAGANPVDFAYSIHSAVGNKMTGARVNGRIVPFEYKLVSGDIVEIITGGSHGPSRDWLKLVKTSEARNKIKQWFKKERREDNIVTGRGELERELKRAGIQPDTIMQKEVLEPALKKMSFITLDDMLAALGYGGVTIRRVMGRFRDELIRLNRMQLSDKAALEKLSASAVRKPRKAVSGVIVEELDNCLIKFARCCAAVPGDPITGYVTRGYGVSVHRTDCPNVQESLKNDSGRQITVSWADEIKDRYETGLQVRCRDRDGLVVDVMNALSGYKIKSMGAKNMGSDTAVISLRLEVDHVKQLTELIGKLNQISGVQEILRRDVDN